MKISIVLTNDWELYGEGSGDFYQVQNSRLQELLKITERNNARLTIFAEVGQQFAHIQAAAHSRTAKGIANAWEKSVANIVARDHDVQLHWHPTWENSSYVDEKWALDLKGWRLADINADRAVDRLIEGRQYLETLGRTQRSKYRCIAFRAGAFCLQPSELTVPVLKRAGILCDSSIVPGFFDYMHFDYRRVPSHLTPYWLTADDIGSNQPNADSSILELPVHTESRIDSPALRRLMTEDVWNFLTMGVSKDPIYKAWARQRDLTLRQMSDQQDPLQRERVMARLHPKWWRYHLIRQSAQIMDLDFTPPQILISRIAKAVERGVEQGLNEITLTLISHANNSHNFENLGRFLSSLNEQYRDQLRYVTVQEITTQAYLKREQEKLITRLPELTTAVSPGVR